MNDAPYLVIRGDNDLLCAERNQKHIDLFSGHEASSSRPIMRDKKVTRAKLLFAWKGSLQPGWPM